MKIVKIDEPQTSKHNYPFLGYHSQIGKVALYLCLDEGYVPLSVPSHMAVFKPYGPHTAYKDKFYPVMGAVTLLNE